MKELIQLRLGQAQTNSSHSPSARPHLLSWDKPKGIGLTLEGESGRTLLKECTLNQGLGKEIKSFQKGECGMWWAQAWALMETRKDIVCGGNGLAPQKMRKTQSSKSRINMVQRYWKLKILKLGGKFGETTVKERKTEYTVPRMWQKLRTEWV